MGCETRAILFAISGTASKFLFNSGITAFQLIQLRTTLACTGLLIWLLIRQPSQLKVSVKDLPYFAGLGVFGIGSAQFFYLFSISKINVAAAILLHYTGPVFVALYAVFVQKQKLGFRSMLAISAGVIAALFLGEMMAPLQIIGGLMVIVSIVLLQFGKSNAG